MFIKQGNVQLQHIRNIWQFMEDIVMLYLPVDNNESPYLLFIIFLLRFRRRRPMIVSTSDVLSSLANTEKSGHVKHTFLDHYIRVFSVAKYVSDTDRYKLINKAWDMVCSW